MPTSAPSKPSLNPQIVGNVGLYYACFHLSLLGWNVMPTARNARGIDVVAYNGDASAYLGIQVKSLSKRSAVPVGTSLSKVMGEYWIVVTRIATSPIAYVLSRDEVLARTHKTEKDGKASYWMEPGAYEVSEFENAWPKITLAASEA
jgi:hypothetical protein